MAATTQKTKTSTKQVSKKTQKQKSGKATKKSVAGKKKTSAVTKTATRTKTVKVSENLPKIKVLGVGGSGKNALNYMIKKDVKGVKFVSINTDLQDLNQSKAQKKIHIGKTITSGAGTGMDPEIGKRAAMETKEEIVDALKDSSIVFVTGGMGGGTGTGATPVICGIARDMGILTVAVVTKPFFFEGGRRNTLADEGLGELSNNVDAYIVIPNDKILEVADEDASMNDAFALSDQVLLDAVTGVSNLITTPGRINIDASDIRTILSKSGMALVGIGSGRGEKRAEQAAQAAIDSPLLDISIRGSQSVLFSISAGDDLKMTEVSTIASTITKEIDPNAVVKFGTIRDLKLRKGEIKVTVIASNFGGDAPTALPESTLSGMDDIPTIVDESVAGETYSEVIDDDYEESQNEGWSPFGRK